MSAITKDNDNKVIRPNYDWIDVKYQIQESNHELPTDVHQFLDYLVWWAISNTSFFDSDKISASVSPCDYFALKNIKNPNSKDYDKFYDNLQRLHFTVLTWLILNRNIERKISYAIITYLDITKSLKDKRKVCVTYELNKSLRYFFKWCDSNIAQNIHVSINLRRKYAYKLYLYMLRRAIEANGVIKVSYDELGRRVGRPKSEENKEFNRCLKAAIVEINKVSVIYNYHNFEILIDKKRDNLTTIRIQQFIKRKRNNNGETSKR